MVVAMVVASVVRLHTYYEYSDLLLCCFCFWWAFGETHRKRTFTIGKGAGRLYEYCRVGGGADVRGMS